MAERRFDFEPRGGDLHLVVQEVAPSAPSDAEQRLEEARLAREDTLGRELTNAERRCLREHRPPAAAHWNLLTNLRAEDLRYAR